jgi:hypothetical protein
MALDEGTKTYDYNGGKTYAQDGSFAISAITTTKVLTGLALFGATDAVGTVTSESRPDSMILNTFIKIN